MARMIGGVCVALAFMGPLALGSSASRPAGAIVVELEQEIKASRRARFHDEFVRGHARIADLVDELRRTSPDDARVAKYLSARWSSLLFLGKGGEVKAEIDATLGATKDPALRKDALFLKTMLALRAVDDRDGVVSLAEAFARQAPDDDGPPSSSTRPARDWTPPGMSAWACSRPWRWPAY